MSISVGELRGVTEELAGSLRSLGIQDTTQLLAATGTSSARVKLAESLGVDASVMLELANRADLTRIPGLTLAYADLMRLAGVDTVIELSRRIPENLYIKLLKVAPQHAVQDVPHMDTVQQWVREAKQLERAVSY